MPGAAVNATPARGANNRGGCSAWHSWSPTKPPPRWRGFCVLEESRQTDRPKDALGEMPPFSLENYELDWEIPTRATRTTPQGGRCSSRRILRWWMSGDDADHPREGRVTLVFRYEFRSFIPPMFTMRSLRSVSLP